MKELDESTQFKIDRHYKLGDYYKNNPDCFNQELDNHYVRNLDLNSGLKRRSDKRKFGTNLALRKSKSRKKQRSNSRGYKSRYKSQYSAG